MRAASQPGDGKSNEGAVSATIRNRLNHRQPAEHDGHAFPPWTKRYHRASRSVNVGSTARLAERHGFAEDSAVNATEPLRRAARRWPDREAVRHGESALTFGAFDVLQFAKTIGHTR